MAFEFPTTDRLGKAVVEQNFVRVTDRRADDPHLHFALFLPKTWRPMDLPAEVPPEDGGLVRLALYHPDGVEPEQAAIEVAVLRQSREVDPADWLRIFLAAAGQTVLKHREVTTDAGDAPDWLTIGLDANNPLVARWVVRKNGPHLFVVQARARIEHYPWLGDVFFFAVTRFTLLNPYQWPLAESLGTFSRRDPGNFLILYPVSWERSDDPVNHPTFLQVKLINRIEGKAVGQLVFASLARNAATTPERLLDDQLAALNLGGVLVSKPLLEKGPPVDDLTETWQALFSAVGTTVGKMELMEARLFIGQRAEWCYVLLLLTPPQERMPSVWAINKRAYDIVLRFFKTAPRVQSPT